MEKFEKLDKKFEKLDKKFGNKFDKKLDKKLEITKLQKAAAAWRKLEK